MSFASAWFAKIAARVLDRAYLWMLALLTVAVGSGVAAIGTTIDFSSESFYAHDGESAAILESFRERWGADDDELLVVIERHAEEGWLDAQALPTLTSLRTKLEGIDGVARVAGPSEVIRAHVDAGDQRSWTRRAPDLWPAVPASLDASGRIACLVVELERSSDAIMSVMPTIEAVELELERFATHEQYSAQIAGIPAIRAAFVALTLRDQMILVPAEIFVVAFGLWFAFRSRSLVLIVGLAAGYPLLVLVGIMAAVGEPIGLLNQTFFTLLPVLAVADSIHWVVRYRELAAVRRAETGEWNAETRRQVVVATAGHMGVSCLLTSVTTAAAFFSLFVSEMPTLRAFGGFAGLGIVLAYGFGLVIMPISLHRFRPPPPEQVSKRQGASWLVELALRSCRARPGVVTMTSLLLVAASMLALQNLRIDNSLLDLLERTHPVHIATRQVDERLGGVFALELEIEGAIGEGPAADEIVHSMLADYVESLRARERVRVVLGPGEVIRPPPVPPVGPAWPPATGLPARAPDPFVNGSVLRVSIRIRDRGGQSFEAFAKSTANELEALPWPHPVEVRATGTSYLAHRGINHMTNELRESLLLVAVVVTLLVAVLFRSWIMPLISIVPNLLPLVVGVAAVALGGWTLDPLAAVVLTMALGIAVDDTIHLLVRLREELSSADAPEDALARAMRGCGPALVVTSSVLAAGLVLNLASSFPPLVQLGALGAVVMTAALVADLWVLPAAWLGVTRVRRRIQER